MDDRKRDMKYLLFLTAFSMVPVYVLLGWQSGGHGPADVHMWFWYIESAAWGIRALVEAWALIYLFNTQSDEDSKNILVGFEIALISLIALTVGLSIVANGAAEPIAQVNEVLFWVWAFSIAAFAPLMMGGVGYAYRIHSRATPTDITRATDSNLELFADMVANQPEMTNRQLAQEFGVSDTTIRNWRKKLQNGRAE